MHISELERNGGLLNLPQTLSRDTYTPKIRSGFGTHFCNASINDKVAVESTSHLNQREVNYPPPYEGVTDYRFYQSWTAR
jgi:hypothetical protein